MRKSCDSCQYKPEFDFFSPTNYDASGYCEAFPSMPEIIEHEDTGDDGDYYYSHEGKVIVDCPCWDLAEEDTSVDFKYKKETDASVRPYPTDGFTDDGDCDCPECRQERAKMAQEASKQDECDGDCVNCPEAHKFLMDILPRVSGLQKLFKEAGFRVE